VNIRLSLSKVQLLEQGPHILSRSSYREVAVLGDAPGLVSPKWRSYDIISKLVEVSHRINKSILVVRESMVKHNSRLASSIKVFVQEHFTIKSSPELQFFSVKFIFNKIKVRNSRTKSASFFRAAEEGTGHSVNRDGKEYKREKEASPLKDEVGDSPDYLKHWVDQVCVQSTGYGSPEVLTRGFEVTAH